MRYIKKAAKTILSYWYEVQQLFETHSMLFNITKDLSKLLQNQLLRKLFNLNYKSTSWFGHNEKRACHLQTNLLQDLSFDLHTGNILFLLNTLRYTMKKQNKIKWEKAAILAWMPYLFGEKVSDQIKLLLMLMNIKKICAFT